MLKDFLFTYYGLALGILGSYYVIYIFIKALEEERIKNKKLKGE